MTARCELTLREIRHTRIIIRLDTNWNKGPPIRPQQPEIVNGDASFVRILRMYTFLNTAQARYGEQSGTMPDVSA